MASQAAEVRARRYDPAETRQRVLEAANRLFTTKGFVATGTADIARAADVSEGSIFYHFGSKKKLLEELGRSYGERMVAAMQPDGEDVAGIVPDIALRRVFDYAIANKMMPPAPEPECAMTGHVIHEHTPETEPFYRAARAVVVAWSENNLRTINARFGVTGVDTSVAATLMYAAVHEAVDMVLTPGVSDEDRERIIAETIRFVGAAVCPLQLAARAAA